MIHELVIDGTPTGKRGDFATPPDFSGHPTKSGWVWLPVIADNAMPKANEVLGPATKVVEAGKVVDRRAARAKTATELADEARAMRNPLDELDALKARVASLEVR